MSARTCRTSHGLGTALVYVGSDLDIFPMEFMRCSERRIVFVDPLIWMRNEDRILAWKARGAKPSNLPASFKQHGYSNDDGFYECPPSCDAAPLADGMVSAIASQLARGMTERCLHRQRHLANASLSGFALHGKRVANLSQREVYRGAQPAIHFDFESRGVRRTFAFYMAAAEDVDLHAVTEGRPVTTLVYSGVATLHGILRQICERGLHKQSLRLISSDMRAHIAWEPGSEGAKYCVDAFRMGSDLKPSPLPCGCAYTDRVEKCYDAVMVPARRSFG